MRLLIITSSLRTMDDGSCLIIIPGCTDELYTEYNPNADQDDGSYLLDKMKVLMFVMILLTILFMRFLSWIIYYRRYSK